VTILLSHYWTANEDPRLRQLQMRDWLEDLSEFPAQQVVAAIREYRQGPTQHQRPKPGDIRLLCVAQQIAAAPKPLALPAPIEKPVRRWNQMTPDEQRAHEEMMAKLREVVPAVKGMTRYRSDDAGSRRPAPIDTRPLPGEDDPEVQAIMKRMGA
jgi:hypothetical protein